MKIKLSRHAKRRAKLYRISKSTIEEILTNINLPQGKHEIIKTVEGYKLSIKIVASVKNDIITVITTYPLKKRRE